MEKTGNRMTQKEFEDKYEVRLIDKEDSLFMKMLGAVLKPIVPNFMTYFFTTIRRPFQKYGTIYYPHGTNPMKYMGVLEHELMHVEQQKTTWGLIKSVFLATLFPLPVFLSGRWFLEREPFLHDIKKGMKTVDQAVDMLWGSYGWCWPKCLMKKWFMEHIDE